MRAIVIFVIVLYVLLAFVGCLDRDSAIESANDGGREKLNEAILVKPRLGDGSVDIGSGLAANGSLPADRRNDHRRRADS
jgi:hypothetical protein